MALCLDRQPLRCPNCNRTYVELKCDSTISTADTILHCNRTYVELKSDVVGQERECRHNCNRTYVELYVE